MACSNLEVLDLFAGMGGLAKGFADTSFSVIGIDINKYTPLIFELNSMGRAQLLDLLENTLEGRFPVVTGGPPCRPWSVLNRTRQGSRHPDYNLIRRFFDHIVALRPDIFLMENVPPVRNDALYKEQMQIVRSEGYCVKAEIVRYGDFGAATMRQRLLTVGVRKSSVGAEEFFARLQKYRKKPQTVRDAIEWLEVHSQGEYPDHVWPNLRTIGRYANKYRSGKYGWYHLQYDRPARSFGNVMKTYILHPKAGKEGGQARVISVREALCIMGFPRDFRLPAGMPVGTRYQMVADAVSPLFSKVCALVIREMIGGIKYDNAEAQTE